MELANVEDCVLSSIVREAFRNHRASTTLSFAEANFIAGRFEQFDSSLADLRIVVIDKRVMKEHNFSGRQSSFRRSVLRFAVLCEPRLKGFRREKRQLAPGVDSDKTVHRPPDDGIRQGPVRSEEHTSELQSHSFISYA